MDYSFFTLQFLLLQCIQEAQYIALQRGNGGSNPSILKEYGRPETRYSYSYEEKYKNICLYARIPMYMDLRSKDAYTREYGFKSHV